MSVYIYRSVHGLYMIIWYADGYRAVDIQMDFKETDIQYCRWYMMIYLPLWQMMYYCIPRMSPLNTGASSMWIAMPRASPRTIEASAPENRKAVSFSESHVSYSVTNYVQKCDTKDNHQKILPISSISTYYYSKYCSQHFRKNIWHPKLFHPVILSLIDGHKNK